MAPPSANAVTMSRTKSTMKANTLKASSQAGWIPFKHGLQVSSSYKTPGLSRWVSLVSRFDLRKPSNFHIRSNARVIEIKTNMPQIKTLQFSQKLEVVVSAVMIGCQEPFDDPVKKLILLLVVSEIEHSLIWDSVPNYQRERKNGNFEGKNLYRSMTEGRNNWNKFNKLL